jgi:hypothetical protein
MSNSTTEGIGKPTYLPTLEDYKAFKIYMPKYIG